MDRQQIDIKLSELEEQIRKSYANVSVLDQVCTTHAVSEEIDYGVYEQFAGKYKIARERITNPSNYLILGELGASVARSEIMFLINEFSNNVKSEMGVFSFEQIDETIINMQSKGYQPNSIFIPIKYWNDVYEWNKTHKPYNSTGSIFDTLHFESASLQIKFSNKKIEFEDVIITSKDVNHWCYRPDKKTKERLTAKFDWDAQDDENAILLVKTVFKFMNTEKDGNVVLKIKDL